MMINSILSLLLAGGLLTTGGWYASSPTTPALHQAKACSGSSSSSCLCGQLGSFSSVSFSQAAGSSPLSLAVSSRL
ncbi:hypothetical protein SAMN04244574_04158 [Azotobacter beijerinckii]|uniref:Uncharacterized protein n=1 Tax=Azotobacter beijerinckii TaxID=170623 RepID=A0A1I4H9Q7_9GAMM|nr:hypothetical protein SAMN04244571_04183 [Azotobacter beijerinckii]SFL38500.1 hypothetical protein SAMN04244574_04158 [Azotobacter beijerinckii]